MTKCVIFVDCFCYCYSGVFAVFGFCVLVLFVFFFQAEDGIRDLVRSRGLGDVYKRQNKDGSFLAGWSYTGPDLDAATAEELALLSQHFNPVSYTHLTLPTIYSV